MKVIIFKEKHADSVYNASSEEQLFANCLFHLETTTLEYMKWDGTSEEKIAEAERAIKEKDGRTAYKILSRRKEYEYEGFSIEEVADYSTKK
jgi:hypothetical protein